MVYDFNFVIRLVLKVQGPRSMSFGLMAVVMCDVQLENPPSSKTRPELQEHLQVQVSYKPLGPWEGEPRLLQDGYKFHLFFVPLRT